MSLTSEEITAKNFKKFYEALSPYLGSYDKGKLTFVGEVKAFFAETAPNGFLVCDGATYNKADYPQLANLLLSLTDHSAYEVSGDDTKFKVPDLRGEFLRGTGTNSHTNQGSGAGVGVHQDGTEHVGTYISNNGSSYYTTSNGDTNNTVNADKSNSGYSYLTSVNGTRIVNDTYKTIPYNYTSRPTNTSVLYCIAYKDTMVDLDFLSYGGERFAKSDMYDTTERVIGKWIDGKPLYQKTIEFVTVAGENSVNHGISNIDKVVAVSGGINTKGAYAGYTWPLMFLHHQYNDVYAFSLTWVNTTQFSYFCGNDSGFVGSSAYITLIYTKTTDTANSFKYSTPTDYSTDEKVVGTWIDGKPLYQKTWSGLSITGTGRDDDTNIDISFVDRLICGVANRGGSNTATVGDANFKKGSNNHLIYKEVQGYTDIDVITLQYTKTTD